MITRKQLAKQVNVSLRTISRWEIAIANSNTEFGRVYFSFDNSKYLYQFQEISLKVFAIRRIVEGHSISNTLTLLESDYHKFLIPTDNNYQYCRHTEAIQLLIGGREND